MTFVKSYTEFVLLNETTFCHLSVFIDPFLIVPYDIDLLARFEWFLRVLSDVLPHFYRQISLK